MRRTGSTAFIAMLLLLSSCATPATPAPPDGQATGAPGQTPVASRQWSQDESRQIAERLLQRSPTYSSRCIENSLRILSTTPQEGPSSWQFDFEFKCEFPGYGRLGSQPTPQVLTSHQARVIVQDGDVTYAVLDGEWPVLTAITDDADITEEPTGTAIDSPKGNLVRVHFGQEHWYDVLGDSFVNRPVSGKRVWRAHAPINQPDETGAPIIRPRLTLDSELNLKVEDDKLTKDGPPTYVWQLADIAEVLQPDAWGWDTFVIPRSPGAVTPGYDVSRSFDRTVFWGEGTQTMTVTVTPREEELGRIGIMVHTDAGDPFVDTVVLSYSGISGAEVSIAEGGHRSEIGNIPAELDAPVTVTVTLRVTPRVPWVFYKPRTAIHTDRPGTGSHGIITGSSVTATNEIGAWTWQAEGDYVWQWFSASSGTDVELILKDSSLPYSVFTLVGLVLAGIAALVIQRRRKKRRAAAG